MSFRARRRGERGSAAVEFALVMPILFMLVFGIIDFGFAINRHSVINNATRDAAREASLGGTEAEIKTVATQGLAGLVPDSVTVTCTTKAGGSCTGANYDAQRTASTSYYGVVTVKYTHQMLTPISIFFGSSIKLDRTAKMRIEK